jgi:hypothetical protein
MSNALSDLLASYQAKVTPATKQAASKRKSVKAQRSAVAKSTRSAKDQHTCWLYGLDKDGNALDGTLVSCVVCSKSAPVDGNIEWAPPARFDVWVKRNYDVELATPNAALDADRADIYLAYDKYVRSVFAVPFNQSVFDRIVRREYAKQLAGLGDLGLLGYSADDIVDLAVFYAWAERVKSYVRAIGADDETAAHISQALRDIRSDAELSEVAKLEGDGRYVYGSDDRLRKQANSLAVRHARERLALRAELRESGLLDGFNYAPTAGEVYRQVKHVFREGMREWRNTLEGLTSDGVIPESVQFSTLQVGNTVDESLFVVTEVVDTSLEREAWIDELKSRELLPAEAPAAAVVEALYRGYSLNEIREQMFASDRDFSNAIKNAKQLFVA